MTSGRSGDVPGGTRQGGSHGPVAPGTAPDRVYSKITRRLVPFLFICYAAAYLDRVNVGFAKLQLKDDLQFSETVYGIGAGIFFVGYILPSGASRLPCSPGAAAGIALINSIGNIGGAAATSLVGWLSDLTGSTASSLYPFGIVLVLVLVGLLVLALPRSVNDGASDRAGPSRIDVTSSA